MSGLKTIWEGTGGTLLALAARLVLGGTFAYASFDKILHPLAFAQNVQNYGLLPMGAINLFALILPWAELLCGAALIIGIWTRAANAIIIGMLLMFVVGLASAISRHLDISCGCFNTSGGHKVGMDLLLRDFGYLVLCAVVWLREREHWGLGGIMTKGS